MYGSERDRTKMNVSERQSGIDCVKLCVSASVGGCCGRGGGGDGRFKLINWSLLVGTIIIIFNFDHPDSNISKS